MSPWQVLDRVVELAVDHGPDVVRAVTSIRQSLRSQYPDLRPPREDRQAEIDRKHGLQADCG